MHDQPQTGWLPTIWLPTIWLPTEWLPSDAPIDLKFCLVSAAHRVTLCTLMNYWCLTRLSNMQLHAVLCLCQRRMWQAQEHQLRSPHSVESQALWP